MDQGWSRWTRVGLAVDQQPGAESSMGQIVVNGSVINGSVELGQIDDSAPGCWSTARPTRIRPDHPWSTIVEYYEAMDPGCCSTF